MSASGPSLSSRAVAEEDHVAVRAAPPASRSSASDARAASRPPARLPPASTPLMMLNVARSTRPACTPACAHAASYCATMSRARHRDDELLAAFGRLAPGVIADDRLLDRERRALPHLPAHQLHQVARRWPAPSRTGSATPWRPCRGRPAPRGAARPPRRPSACASAAADHGDVGMLGAASDGDDRARRQRLDGVAGDARRRRRATSTRAAATRSAPISIATSGGAD